jgi:8-oxo-dGTP pyrophosphatase MutT (NUDIX family)
MTSTTFPNRLPESRLGQSHPSLDAFRQATQFTPLKSKEFTLVVVTSSPNRILLGLKNRGFGMGMYNSFGGKFDHPEESVEACACRELQEETNISIPLEEMKKHNIGIQRYTFENDPVEMIMHVFRIHLKDEQANELRGCEKYSRVDG